MTEAGKAKKKHLQELTSVKNENAALKSVIEKDRIESKSAVDNLTVSETRYRRLFESAQDGILILDAETGNILDVNPFLIEMLGYSKDELIEKKIWEIGFFKDITANKEKFTELQNKEYVRYENLPLETNNGRKINVEFVSNVYLVNHSKVIQCNIRDITDRSRSELERQVLYDILLGATLTSNLDELLKFIHMSLKRVIYAENCFIALHDGKTGLFSFPYFVDQIDSVPPPMAIGRSCTSYVFRTNRPVLLTPELFNRLREDNEIELIGSPSPSWMGVPLKTPAGTIGVLVVQHYTDKNIYDDSNLKFLHSVSAQTAAVIERKINEEELRDSEEKLNALFNSMSEMVALHELVYNETGDPVNYRIIDCNGAFTEVTGIKKEDALGKLATEVFRTDFAPYLEIYSQVAISGKSQKFSTFFAPMNKYFSISVVSPKRNQFATVTDDITAIKLIEEEQQTNIELLRIINASTSKEDLIESTVVFLKQWLKCDAVGIRLKDGDDFPYFETSGFPERFVRAERYLCSYNAKGELERDEIGNPVLECMCGNIICGRFDPSKSFFTDHGSFWSNCTSDLLASTTEADRQARTRNRCNGEGYESVGLFPFRFKGETLGLLQVNHKQKSLFTPKRLSILERFGDNLAIALAHHRGMELLKQSEERFRKIFEDHVAVKLLIDPDSGNIIDANKAAVEYYGWTKAELQLMNIYQINTLPEEEIKRNMEFAETRQNGGFILKHRMKNGTIRDVEIFTGKMEIGENKYLHSIVHDITERRRVEQEIEIYRNHLEDMIKLRTEELNEANTELRWQIEKQKEYELMLQHSLEKEKELNEMKSRFISTTSHEFRTPLSSILSSTELLQRYSGKMSDIKKDGHLDKIKSSVEYLTRLLDDVLTISRTETGKISFKPEQMDIYKFAEECVDDARSLATEKHKIKCEFPSQQKEFWLDKKLMKFIINNLLSNAIKYSPDGGEIGFCISIDETNLLIKVSDEGIGIPAEDIGMIFDPFYRSKNTGLIAGTGLGLAIVKRAVELHNGEIKIMSELDKGTTFIVKIPIGTSYSDSGTAR
jgi:PAS domain S-box-containing protein